MDKVSYLFKSYNSVLKQVYEQIINIDEKNPVQMQQPEPGTFDTMLKEAERIWEKTQDGNLGGLSPEAYLGSFAQAGQLLDIFRVGAQICDEKLPDILVEKLRTFGNEAEIALRRIIASPFDAENDLELLPVITAIELLGDWKSTDSIDILLDLLYHPSSYDDVVSEYAQKALEKMGSAAVEAILKKLDASNSSEQTCERLLSVLAAAGRECRTEEIYRVLKEYFRNTGDKGFGASLLGVYRDGRAVTVLKSYVDRNLANISPEVFYEIKLAVEMLGGSMSDIEFITI